MVKVDLITGFLGSGKTTFIKKYAQYLIDQGYRIGIIENDFGAVNVDMMLLQDLESENCELEMVAGACDKDCHQRRFKTKLISMGMRGFDRVLVEPSSLYYMNNRFNQDEFIQKINHIFKDQDCGHVMRVKGFYQKEKHWYEINMTQEDTSIQEINQGQDVIIVIGEELNKNKIDQYFK